MKTLTILIVFIGCLSDCLAAETEFSTCDIRGRTQIGDYFITNNGWGLSKLKGDPTISMICLKGNSTQNNSLLQ